MELGKLELQNTIGGAAKIGLGIVVGALISFFVGLIDGYLRPLKCNK